MSTPAPGSAPGWGPPPQDGPPPAPGWGPPPHDGTGWGTARPGANGWAAPPAGARDVVTGEAVALELRLAKLPSRALALFIDLGLMGITLFVVAVLALLAASNTDDALGAAIFLVSVIAVVIGYPVAFETLSRGRSPGKAALGLRVVRDDGGPVRFRHALTRALIGVLVDFNPLLVGAIGVLTSLASSKGKRVGDMLAGTVVLRERVPATKTPPALMPPHLAQWAAGLPVTRLPDALALEARQVLGRLDELEPEIGEALCRQLADEVLVTLGVSAPGGADPVALLSAVLAERRDRELARAGFPPGPWGTPPGGPSPAAPLPGVAPGWGPPPAATWGQPPAPQPAWGQPPAPQPAWGQPPTPQPTWGQPPTQPTWDQLPAQPTWDQPRPTDPEPPSSSPFAPPG